MSRQTRNRRSGVTLVEMLVVLGIIGTMLALLLPAVQQARARARATACQNNLHQIRIAAARYMEDHDESLPAGFPGYVSGWTIKLLPYLEQGVLHDRILEGTPLEDAPDFLLKRPRILRCPSRWQDDPAGAMDISHYVLLMVGPDRFGKTVFDAPLDVNEPWASGPAITRSGLQLDNGPHNGSFQSSSGR